MYYSNYFFRLNRDIEIKSIDYIYEYEEKKWLVQQKVPDLLLKLSDQF